MRPDVTKTIKPKMPPVADRYEQLHPFAQALGRVLGRLGSAQASPAEVLVN